MEGNAPPVRSDHERGRRMDALGERGVCACAEVLKGRGDFAYLSFPATFSPPGRSSESAGWTETERERERERERGRGRGECGGQFSFPRSAGRSEPMGEEVRAYQHLVTGRLAHAAQVGSEGLQLLVVLLNQPGSDLTSGREEEEEGVSDLGSRHGTRKRRTNGGLRRCRFPEGSSSCPRPSRRPRP